MLTLTNDSRIDLLRVDFGKSGADAFFIIAPINNQAALRFGIRDQARVGRLPIIVVIVVVGVVDVVVGAVRIPRIVQTKRLAGGLEDAFGPGMKAVV